MITITPPDQGEGRSPRLPPKQPNQGPCPGLGFDWKGPLGREGHSPVPGTGGSGSASLEPSGACLSFPSSLPADDNMECVDSERRPHFPQFSYSASGTA